MQISDWNVVPFTEESLAATRSNWLQSASDLDMPSLDYEIQLDWASAHMSYDQSSGTSLAYGIVDPSGEVVALLEVVHTLQPGPAKGWLKMLSIKLAPKYAPAQVEADAAKVSALIAIYGSGIIGTVKLTGVHQARTVKLYGRDATMLNLLVGLKEVLPTTIGHSVKVEMQGRWLVLQTQ